MVVLRRLREWRAQREKQAPEHKALYAVAIDESTDKVLGFVYCCGHGMKCDLHTPERASGHARGRAVSADARGMRASARNYYSGPKRKRSRAATRSCRSRCYGATGRRACISGSVLKNNRTRTAATSAASAAS